MQNQAASMIQAPVRSTLGYCPPDRLPSPYREEAACVEAALAQLEALDWAAVQAVATPWVEAIRAKPAPFWALERLLQEYPISSDEGLALMRLAESLLRVPDTETAMALTADQLSRADFEGSADSALTRLSGLALQISKHFLPENLDASSGGAPSLSIRLGGKAVVAATLRAVQLLGKQFVLGENIASATKAAAKMRKDQPLLRFSYDMLGEGARTAHDAAHYYAAYENAIEHLSRHTPAGSQPENNDGISIKLSALHPRYEFSQLARLEVELIPRIIALCDQAARANINLTIDAEEVDRLELSLAIFEPLLAHVATHHPAWGGLGLALQAYQTRGLDLIAEVVRLARHYKLRLMCRLVKGAYWDTEIKRAQELGLPHYPVFTHKHHTDIHYLACAKTMLAARDVLFSQFATHNAATIAAVRLLADSSGALAGTHYELQRLFGMGEGVYREALNSLDAPCRVYAPVGTHKELLAYLVRRLLENGANSSFVHKLGDPSVDVAALLSSPLHHDARRPIPLPVDLYLNNNTASSRKNSTGLDVAEGRTRSVLEAAYQSVPISPVAENSVDDTVAAMQAALIAYPKWNALPVQDRAKALQVAADEMEAALPAWCALLVKEAHKAWPDAVSEVREAIDFLRYYALEAQRIQQPLTLPGPTGEDNTLTLKGRGVWVCISPWNFPLAIFMGQVAAALVTGNAVLAKPAEQTPFVALEAVKLLHRAGVPEAALHLLHGAGETVGAALVNLPQVAGVVFTGSTQVAKIIQRSLAAKDGAIVPLIAETGGLNAMLVDSTALPEQVCDAVVQSSFRSAGQRCSALRILCIYESIYEPMLKMLRGALKELSLGNAAHYANDVGAVIDQEAQSNIRRQVEAIEAIEAAAHSSPNTVQAALTRNVDGRHYITPRILEREKISDIQEEIFGPILQVVKWSGDPQAAIAAINALGYGLTLGIQTRIDSRALYLAKSAHIGNVYINRSTIGAVVGVQPFGGEGLSGTGPKAGGPHYLPRFCAEQTITVNTAAAGGNAALMARAG